MRNTRKLILVVITRLELHVWSKSMHNSKAITNLVRVNDWPRKKINFVGEAEREIELDT